MTRWLMKFEVEGYLGIHNDFPMLVFTHPIRNYTVHLQNKQMLPGCEEPLLTAHLIFESRTIDVADTEGLDIFGQFLDFMVFATGSRFGVKRRICLFDWSEGIENRQGLFFKYFPDPSWPQLILNQQLSDSIEKLLPSDKNPSLMQALNWYAAAVTAKLADEQFQLFWFAIETLARQSLEKDKVEDLCARCRTPLYCPTCKKVSTHRPYPSQVIEKFFKRFNTEGAERNFTVASAMRHAMLHGANIEDIENRDKVKLAVLIEIVQKIAWKALLTALAREASPDGAGQLGLFTPSSFLHSRLAVKAKGSFKSPAGRDTLFTDIPEIDMQVTVRDNEEQKEDA